MVAFRRGEDTRAAVARSEDSWQVEPGVRVRGEGEGQWSVVKVRFTVRVRVRVRVE